MSQFSERIHELFATPLTENVTLFSVMLAIILIMPIITKKLRLPQVIGLILCGVIVGPHALNIVDNSGAIGLFSTIGLLYIMFMAGLELDMNQFKVNRNRSFLFGFLTYLGPLLVIFPICYWGYNLGLLESFLVGSMFGTHTLIAYPAVSRMGVSRDPSVAVTVGGTILVDAGVLILLAVILGLAGGNLTLSFWVELVVSLLAFTGIMFFIIPRIGEWFFAHWHNEKYLRYIFIIFMVFLSALIAEIAGLEGIVGAFVAGLVLNRMIPAHSTLMHHIEFVGNALFIPFFLVTVGMLVDVGVIMQGPATIILAVILSAAALLGKYIAAFVAQKLFGYSAAQRNVMFGLSGARVAATLAIVLVAYNAGLLDEIFLNAAILLILITCITASFVTESAAKQLAIEHEHTNPEAQIHSSAANEHILMPVANPAHVDALMHFAEILRAPQSKHRTTLLSVVPDNAHAETNIRTFKKALEPHMNSEGGHKLRLATAIDPSLSEGIARAVREQLATLLLLGWPKSGLTDMIIGEKWRAVVHDIDKLIMWADLPAPLTKPRRIALFTLQNCELQSGFDDWFDKIVHIAEHFSMTIAHFGNSQTTLAMRKRLEETQKSIVLSETDVNPFDVLKNHDIIQDDDWLVFASARPNTVCHVPECEHIPGHWSKYYSDHNKILLFPAQPCEADEEFCNV